MRKILLTIVSIAALGALVACGGGSSSIITTVPTPPSAGNNAGFTTASLSGTYVFSASGYSGNTSYAVTGSFVADGKGGITSGTRDTTTDSGGQALNESITGTYTVNQDGRGQAILNGSSGQVIYRFVLDASGQAKLFQISDTSDATGRFLPWPDVVPAVVPAQVTYVVRLDGEDTATNPYGAVGVLTLNTAGGTITGTLDENDAGTFTSQFAVTGTFTGSGTRNTMSITTATGNHNFVYYPVAEDRIELVSTDVRFFLHGYAYAQGAVAGTQATFAGDQVFSISGYDTVGNVLETGRFTLGGAAGTLTNAVEDYNEGGNYYDSVPFTGNYSVAANGRWSATFTYTSSSMGVVGWQISPQQSVVLVTGSTASNYAIVETGTMRAQTLGLTNTSVAGNYAEDLNGLYFASGSVESGGNLLADGAGNLSGTIDSQTPSSINTDVATTGSYAVDGTLGHGSGTVGGVPVHVFTVDANTMYLISTDPNRLYQGMMVSQ